MDFYVAESIDQGDITGAFGKTEFVMQLRATNISFPGLCVTFHPQTFIKWITRQQNTPARSQPSGNRMRRGAAAEEKTRWFSSSEFGNISRRAGMK